MTENPALAFNLYNYHQQPAAAAPPAGSRRSRWNPTPEQLMSLKELYRCGIKTPTAQQIRQVTAMLLRFGRVEGKNVFYWFQNHRARERQKRRRELMAMSHSHCNEKQESSSVMQERMSMSHSSQAQCINAPDANPLDCDHCGREIQTLELFPLQSDNVKGVKVSKLIN